VMMLGTPKLDFPGTDFVYIRGGSYNFSGATSIKYAGTLIVSDLAGITNLMSFVTPYTGGILVMEGQQSPGTGAITLPAAVSNVVDITGIPNRALVAANYGSAQQINNFTGGYEGQEITVVAFNTNTTIHRGAGINLKGNGAGPADFAMGSNDFIVLRRSSGGWFEVARKWAGAAALTDEATANATDLATAIALVNSLKAKFNTLLANRRTAAEQA
jgi:hypothetical protein